MSLSPDEVSSRISWGRAVERDFFRRFPSRPAFRTGLQGVWAALRGAYAQRTRNGACFLVEAAEVDYWWLGGGVLEARVCASREPDAYRVLANALYAARRGDAASLRVEPFAGRLESCDSALVRSVLEGLRARQEHWVVAEPYDEVLHRSESLAVRAGVDAVLSSVAQ